MPFEKGNRINPGGMTSPSRRKFRAALERAMDEGGDYTFDDLAQDMIAFCRHKDPSIALKAMFRIIEEVDGKPATAPSDPSPMDARTAMIGYFQTLASIAAASEEPFLDHDPDGTETGHLALAERPDSL